MTDEELRLTNAYRRAWIGLAVAALLWVGGILFVARPDGGTIDWLIPIAAAALSLFCFSRYSELKSQISNLESNDQPLHPAPDGRDLDGRE